MTAEERLALSWGPQLIALPDGDFVIGRGSSCDLMLDDDKTSRRHALIRSNHGSATIEDLGSRNGVVVNDEKITECTALRAGDKIGIGAQSFEVVAGRRRGAPAPTAAENPRLAVSEAAVRSLAQGDLSAAALGLSTLRLTLRAALARGLRAEPIVLQRYAQVAIELAQKRDDGRWLDGLFEIWEQWGTALPQDAVEHLERLQRSVWHTIDAAKLARYLRKLRSAEAPLSAGELERIGRLEVMLHRVQT